MGEESIVWFLLVGVPVVFAVKYLEDVDDSAGASYETEGDFVDGVASHA